MAEPLEPGASERAIRAQCEAGRHAEATTAALTTYGVELLGFSAPSPATTIRP